MNKSFIATADAPAAIGTYSQAVKVGQTTYLSGQIPLVPDSMALVEGDIEAEIRQAFSNLKAVCEAAGGGLRAGRDARGVLLHRTSNRRRR